MKHKLFKIIQNKTENKNLEEEEEEGNDNSGITNNLNDDEEVNDDIVVDQEDDNDYSLTAMKADFNDIKVCDKIESYR